MKTIKLLVGALLAASLVLNAWLWQQRSHQRAELEGLQAGANEAEALRAEIASLKKSTATPSPEADSATLELARLRNEVAQLRKQSLELNALKAQAAEAAALRAQLAAAKKDLTTAEKQLADTVKVPPEQLQAAKQEAQSISCVNNLKQIVLAARLYANEHANTFPPDFVSMRNELNTPKILFCPAAPGGVQAADWSQLNPGTISYQFLNPNGGLDEPQKMLAICSIHGHVCLSDGSVQRKK